MLYGKRKKYIGTLAYPYLFQGVYYKTANNLEIILYKCFLTITFCHLPQRKKNKKKIFNFVFVYSKVL